MTLTKALYTPGEFKDNCGFGLIAHMEGKASRLVSTAIESLTCMTHRGGIAADGKTGDGCGLLLAAPKASWPRWAPTQRDVRWIRCLQRVCCSYLRMKAWQKKPVPLLSAS